LDITAAFLAQLCPLASVGIHIVMLSIPAHLPPWEVLVKIGSALLEK